MSNSDFFCEKCNEKVEEDDDFCANCGTLFTEGHSCSKHKNMHADGVCIICCEPFCADCLWEVHGRYLCASHFEYEIYQNMARVYGTSDINHAEYLKNFLETEGLHPFLFSRKAGPISLGGPEYTLFRASGDYDGHLINEMKLMVPLQEVTKAEELLTEFEKE